MEMEGKSAKGERGRKDREEDVYAGKIKGKIKTGVASERGRTERGR